MTDHDLDALLASEEMAALTMLVEAARSHRDVRESAFVQDRLEEHVSFRPDEVQADLRALGRATLAAHAPSDAPRRYAGGPWRLSARPRPGGGWFLGLTGPSTASLLIGDVPLELAPRRWSPWSGTLPSGELILRDPDGVEIILVPVA